MLRENLIRSVAALAVLGLAACGPSEEPVPVQDPAFEEPVLAPEAEPAPVIEAEPAPVVEGETEPGLTPDTAIVDEAATEPTEEPAAY